MVPSLETVGNKRVYTDKRIHFFRAIITLTRTGETLASIQEMLNTLTIEEIEKIGQRMHLYDSSRVLENETLAITEDVAITISPRISAELKQIVIESDAQALRGDTIFLLLWLDLLIQGILLQMIMSLPSGSITTQLLSFSPFPPSIREIVIPALRNHR